MNKARILFWINFVMFWAFLISAGTGLPFAYSSPPLRQSDAWKLIHAASGALVFTGVVIHLVIHAKWIEATAKRWIKKASWLTRANFCVDLLLGWVFLLICISGLNIWLASTGHAALIQIEPSLWERMHRGTGTAMTVYIAIHLALHGRWIQNALRNAFKRPILKTNEPGLLPFSNGQTGKILRNQ